MSKIFFIQGSADLLPCLNQHHITGEDANDVFVVINNIYIFNYLINEKKLSNVYFFEAKNYNSIIGAFLLRYSLHKFFIKIRLNYEEINFSSNLYDLPTVFLINKLIKLNKRVKVNCLNVYKLEYICDIKADVFKKLFIYLLFNVDVTYKRFATGIQPFYEVNSKVNLLDCNSQVIVKIKMMANINARSILFIDNFNEISDYEIYPSYMMDIDNIFAKIKENGFGIYIKTHPRIEGNKEIFKNKGYTVIEDKLPLELYDISAFSAVVGVDSAALSKSVHPLKISLLHILAIKDNEKKLARLRYILNEDISILIPNSIERLESLICSI